MYRFLSVLILLFFVSCSGNGAQKISSLSDDASEVPDNSGTAETGDSNEKNDDETPSLNDGSHEIQDETVQEGSESENGPDGGSNEDDKDLLPDDEENGESDNERPDSDLPLCGSVFNGSNCAASSCETVEDCCGADLCVATDGCGGAKVCRNAFFKEDFDSYVAGSFPNEKWTLKYYGEGTQYQVVTSEKYVSAENSMHLLGRSNKKLSAIMTAVLPEVPDVINVEAKMNTEGDDVSFALCTFEREDGRTNWGDIYLKVELANGKIRYQIPEWTVYENGSPSYEPDHWYKIRAKMDQLKKTVSLWVDDELKVENQPFDLDYWSIPNICLASNKQYHKVWFDDIFVWGE